MKKTFQTALTCLLLLLLPAAGCITSQPAERESPAGTSFLWKLEEGNAVLYFFGSIHLATADLYPLAEPVYAAYEAAENLVVEVNVLDQQNTLETQQLTIAQGLFPGGETIANYLSPETSEKLTLLAGEYGLPIEMARQFKPWFAEITITVKELTKLGFDPTLGIDIHFLQRATDEGKNILELETVAQQIGFMNDAPMEEQILSLESTLEEMAQLPEMLTQLLEAWKSGDTEEFSALSMTQLKAQPEYLPIYERLLSGRNKVWADQFEEYIRAGGTYFIVTGAGHLAGRDNVIEILQARGYNPVQQ